MYIRVSHVHAGTVHAPDAELALQNARDLFTRRSEGVSLWVVKSSEITASDPDDRDAFFDPAADKTFRHPTDFELRVGILEQKLALEPEVTVPREVVEFLAHRITSNVRELEGAMKRVIAYHALMGRAISLEMVQEVLADVLRANARKVSIDDIQRKVAEHYNIRMAEMSSARRARAVARPRQVAMFLAKRLTSRSLPEIGRKFGNRDHTTVLHGVRRIEELIQSDVSLAEDVRMLEAALSN